MGRRTARISAALLPVLASLALALAGAVVASQPVTLPGQVQLFTPWHSSVNKSSPHSDYYPRCALLVYFAVAILLHLKHAGCPTFAQAVSLLRCELRRLASHVVHKRNSCARAGRRWCATTS